MDEALLAAYRATDYRVRLARGGWTAIRIDQPLPAVLQALAGGQAWGFITAWHPRSRALTRAQNRAAQRSLLAALCSLPELTHLSLGVGVSADGVWKEPSFWVIGPSFEALDLLAQQFMQLGYVQGESTSTARLRLTPDA